MKIIPVLLFLLPFTIRSQAQCTGGISIFPYTEGFEINDGGWVSGGTGNDWAWGTPGKTVINTAGGGTKCWIVGGLSGTSYTNAEASWLQSPCFDFTGLQYPYITFKVNWESEQQFDGGSFQFSLDNGASWETVGAAADPRNCLNENWFNYNPVNFLAPLSASRNGWSGNIQPTGGSCRGGNGSNGWLLAKHTMPYLGGRSGVQFRFIFGAGTICNNYDGFAIDDIMIGEAPPNAADFSWTCASSKTVNFTNRSANCPDNFAWNFGDPASGSANTATIANPAHTFSGPGKYTVSLTASGPGNAPSTISKDIYIMDVQVSLLAVVGCQSNTGGSLLAQTGVTGSVFNYTWNSNPPQDGPIATGLPEGDYTVTVTGVDACPASGKGRAEKDLSCIGVYFPSAFTPDNNGVNDRFGPLGSIFSLKEYSLSIYNRWGQRVFYSTNPLEKWDGRVMGFSTDTNMFTWLARYQLPGQSATIRKGTVVLIR